MVWLSVARCSRSGFDKVSCVLAGLVFLGVVYLTLGVLRELSQITFEFFGIF